MEITRLQDLRPRTVWDIVDDAFDLYRENFVLFAGVTAVIFVPYFLLDLALRSALIRPGGSDAASGSLVYLLAVAPLTVIVYTLQAAPTAIAVNDLLRGVRPSIGTVYARLVRRLLPLFLATVIFAIMCLFGVLLFYVGLLLMITYYAFVAQAVVLEGRGPLAAGRRSRDLTTSEANRVFGMVLLLGMLSALLSAALTSLLGLFVYAVPFFSSSEDSVARELRGNLIGPLLSGMAGALLAPVQTITLTLLYFDLRVRHEGMDMEAQADAAGIPLAPDPFGGIGFGDAAAAKKAKKRAEKAMARDASRHAAAAPQSGGVG